VNDDHRSSTADDDRHRYPSPLGTRNVDVS
jgi:hypothetical protein